jgi:UTP-glucose-1-phosphate uridylyltransferase
MTKWSKRERGVGRAVVNATNYCRVAKFVIILLDMISTVKSFNLRKHLANVTKKLTKNILF